MSYNFLTGKEYLKRKKTRERKKLISVALGFPDLVFAAGAIPVFPIRMETFKMNTILLALNSATSVLGWDLTSKALDLARQFDILKIVDKILEEVIKSINMKYNMMYDLGIENKVPPNLCYGINALYGMHISKGKNVDGNLNFAMRCGEWNKLSELLKLTESPQIWVDIPPKDLGNTNEALDLMVDNIKNAITQLEDITGNLVTTESLNKQFRIGNQVKRFYKTIIYEIGTSSFYPCNPATLAEILALLTISYQDYNSNAQRYLDNIGHLVKEMRSRIRKKIGTNVSETPRLLFTPIFSGWDPKVHEMISNLGGRIIYADWDIFGLLEEIPVSSKLNPVESYAKFLLDASNKGLGCDKEALTHSYIKAAKDLKIDGVIFNQVSGCSSISSIYNSILEKFNEDLEIPAIVVQFKKIGEDLDEIKLKLANFMNNFK